MTMAYRRHSGANPNWNRNTAFPSRSNHPMLSLSPVINHRMIPNSLSHGTSNTPTSPSSNPSTYNSEQLRLYQSTSRAVRTPSIPTVSEDPREQIETNGTVESKHGEPESADILEKGTDILAKGKEPEVVRTRPIFHANLEEAKKYHQNHLKTSTTSGKKIPVLCQEIICRYCDHFQFQLPVLETDRLKDASKRRVLLRIKKRLVGIGEGQTTFQAMLAAYDDAVLYLFNDPKLQNKLLQPNEFIEWHQKRIVKT